MCTHVYTLALSFVVFSPSFLGNMYWSRGDLSPEYLQCALWGTYTVFPGVLTMRALGCLHCVLWGAYTMSAGGMATYVTNG